MTTAATTKRRAFAATFLLVLAGQYAAVLALNLLVNPRGEFPTRLVEPLTTTAEEDKLLAFARLSEPPRALVLGSSRVWSLPPATLDALGEGPAFNFAVPGGTARHALETYEYALSQGADPRVLYVDASDWALENWSDAAWRPERGPTLRDVGAYAGPLAASYDWSYVKDSWTALERALSGDDAQPRFLRVQPDGRVAYEAPEAQMARGAYDWRAVFELNLPFAKAIYGRVDSLDPALLADLDALLALARGHGARVVLVMPPFLEESVNATSPEQFRRLHAEARAALVARCGGDVAVYDFTDPRSFGADRSRFVDGWHYTAANGDRLLRAAHDPALDLCAAA